MSGLCSELNEKAVVSSRNDYEGNTPTTRLLSLKEETFSTSLFLLVLASSLSTILLGNSLGSSCSDYLSFLRTSAGSIVGGKYIKL